MKPKQIIIPIEDPQEAVAAEYAMGELASLSGLNDGRNGLSLHDALKAFLDKTPAAKAAMQSVDAADENANPLAYRLYAYLRELEFNPGLLYCQGFKGELKDCSPSLEDAVRTFGSVLVSKDLIHFAVAVGNIVIDLGFRRLGSEFMHSNNSVVGAYKRYWSKCDEVPGAYRMQAQDFVRFVKNALEKTDLKQMYNKAMEARQGNAPMQATAAAVVNAFAGARRNRKMRGVVASGDGRLAITIQD